MIKNSTTNYHNEANHFSHLPDYSIECGTDFLAVKEAPRLIKQIHPLNKILDLGCGTGLATRFLKKHFPNTQVIGADINESMLKQAIAADKSGVYVHINEPNSQHPFMPHTFDVIVCSFVLHENRTEEELNLFLKNVSTLLRPNGIVIGWDVYKNLFQGQWMSIEVTELENNEIKEGEPYEVRLLPAGAHVRGRYWSPETLQQLGVSHGLITKEILYPLATKDDKINWKDEVKLAPYFVWQAQKQV